MHASDAAELPEQDATSARAAGPPMSVRQELRLRAYAALVAFGLSAAGALVLRAVLGLAG